MTTNSQQTQKKGLAITLISTVAIIVFVVALFVYTMTQPRMMTVKELAANGVMTFEEPKPVEAFSLVDQFGQPFTEKNLAGQWTILFFGFSHCGGYCPTTLAMLDEFKNQLKSDVADNTQFVMVSVDPQRDTPERLKDYMANFDEEFVGVTGEFLPIKLLSGQFFVSFQKEVGVQQGDHYEVSHGEQLILINPNGQYHGYFNPPFTLGRLKTTYQSIVLQY